MGEARTDADVMNAMYDAVARREWDEEEELFAELERRGLYADVQGDPKASYFVCPECSLDTREVATYSVTHDDNCPIDGKSAARSRALKWASKCEVPCPACSERLLINVAGFAGCECLGCEERVMWEDLRRIQRDMGLTEAGPGRFLLVAYNSEPSE